MTHRALLEHTEIHWSPPSMIGLTRLYVLMVELERRRCTYRPSHRRANISRRNGTDIPCRRDTAGHTMFPGNDPESRYRPYEKPTEESRV